MRSGTDVRSSQHHLHHHCYINWTLAKCSIYECNITSTASSLMSPLPSHLAINQQYHSKPTLTECSVTLRWALPAIGWVFFFCFTKTPLDASHWLNNTKSTSTKEHYWDGGVNEMEDRSKVTWWLTTLQDPVSWWKQNDSLLTV